MRRNVAGCPRTRVRSRSSIGGVRLSRCCRASCASTRASAAPAQKCGPWPNARCGRGGRRISRRLGLGNAAGSGWPPRGRQAPARPSGRLSGRESCRVLRRGRRVARGCRSGGVPRRLLAAGPGSAAGTRRCRAGRGGRRRRCPALVCPHAGSRSHIRLTRLMTTRITINLTGAWGAGNQRPFRPVQRGGATWWNTAPPHH